MTQADLLGDRPWSMFGRPGARPVWRTRRVDAYRQTTDIVIVGVNYKDRPTKALQWLAQYGNPYDVVLDDQDGLLGIEMGVYGAPETFLLNAAGEVVYKRVGDINPRIWRMNWSRDFGGWVSPERES